METPASDRATIREFVLVLAEKVVAGTTSVTAPPDHPFWDSAVPPNPVLGASVLFQSLLGRTNNAAPIVSVGDTNITTNPLPILLGTSQTSVVSDLNGMASMQPSTGSFQGALAILGTVTAGGGTMPFQLQSLWPLIQ